jgi:hypothetical protein
MKRWTLLALMVAASVNAASLSVNPIADAFVAATEPNSNYGGGGALDIAAATSPKGEFDSLLRFDLSALKSNFDATFGSSHWTIDSITLQLTTGTPSNGIFNSNASGLFALRWMQNDTWTEGSGTPTSPGATGITYATLASFLSGADEFLGTFLFAGGTSGSATWVLSRTESFLADVTNGNTLSILASPADNTVAYLFNSRTFGTVSARPTLTVNASAVPEPSGTLLIGLAAILGIARRPALPNVSKEFLRSRRLSFH